MLPHVRYQADVDLKGSLTIARRVFDTMLLVQVATQALEAAGRKVPESAWY